MGADYCRTCEFLKVRYFEKLHRFLIATRAPHGFCRGGPGAEEVNALMEDALLALQTLVAHARPCYGLEEQKQPQNEAA